MIAPKMIIQTSKITTKVRLYIIKGTAPAGIIERKTKIVAVTLAHVTVRYIMFHLNCVSGSSSDLAGETMKESRKNTRRLIGNA